MTHLSDTLNDANPQNLSSRRISDIASTHGHEVHFSTIARYLKGRHPIPPKIEVLEAFSSALGVSIGKFLEAGGLTESHGKFDLPTRADLLDETERKAVISMIDTILRAKKPGSAATPVADAASYLDALTPDERTRLRSTPRGSAALAALDARESEQNTHPERGDYDLAAYQPGGTWESKARAEADAARGEESQEHPTND